ncbi:IMPACT family member YigZ [Vibrio stylophorae]|uniref:IMPACT family member YigZ n=1 Tax=Vibrio stylophorae TaxID=659351 RepID=A0ABM8ZWM3_9VIBR|nr:YigZ family protein [Vibrio stylophorae]CAH0534743.1 IMPACT family member YigZ [Vibrio stylophorae]
MAEQAYPIPTALCVVEEEIKKSRFITYLAHTPGIDAARAFIAEIKAKHHDARHNCWAFVAGKPTDSMQWGCSDDGEPSGTAGKPMLGQLSGSGVGEVSAVVTRYYGGIRLGTGGLVKAYGGGVQAALAALQTELKKPLIQVACDCQYSQLSLVEKWAQAYQAETVVADYGEQIHFEWLVDVRDFDTFASCLFDQSHGCIKLKKITPN